jgi:SAM-dependent methyltransferase
MDNAKKPFKPLTSPLNNADTSWEEVGNWYNEKVGEKGLYYHRKIIIPKTLKIFRLHKQPHYKLLDLGCGQGVFSRHLPDNGEYVGYDESDLLIGKAGAHKTSLKSCQFLKGDITKEMDLKNDYYTHCLIMLALQDSGQPEEVFKNAYKALEDGGRFLIIINHPCFRIPKQSEWKIFRDIEKQMRAISSYLSPREEKLRVHPSQGKKSPTTTWHHHSLSHYSKALKKTGFLIKEIYEWTSDKVSTGRYAKMENRAREEIPLFMAIEAVKYSQESSKE